MAKKMKGKTGKAVDPADGKLPPGFKKPSQGTFPMVKGGKGKGGKGMRGGRGC